LAASVVTKLGGKKGCETAVKSQLSEIDSTEVDVEAVHVSGTTATVTLKSVYRGKKKSSTATLILEGGKWKISALS
jgi:copper chaperone CopZ